jgi:hypothetical protein
VTDSRKHTFSDLSGDPGFCSLELVSLFLDEFRIDRGLGQSQTRTSRVVRLLQDGCMDLLRGEH